MDQTDVKCGDKSRRSPSGRQKEDDDSDGKVIQEEEEGSAGGFNLREEESGINLDLCQEAGKHEAVIQGGECHPPLS